MINVVFVFFPYSMSFSVIYLTCPILPETQGRASDCITLIESIITISAGFFERVARIFSRLFSESTCMLSPVTQSLSALSNICPSVSSPLM